MEDAGGMNPTVYRLLGIVMVAWGGRRLYLALVKGALLVGIKRERPVW